jgi:hypothetical protein
VAAGLVLGWAGTASAEEVGQDQAATSTSVDSGSTPVDEGQPEHEDPGYEIPGYEHPGTEQPGTEQPGTEQPGTEQPGTEQPGTEQPGTEQPGTEQPGTEHPPVAPEVAGNLGLGCDGLVTGTITVTGLSAGTPFTVIAEDGDATASTTVPAQEGATIVPVLGVVSDDAVLTVAVLFADDIITPELDLPIRDLCTGTGTIVLDRDCATPDVVVATVHVTGLQGTEHLVGFVGTSGEKDVVLANPEVVTAVDGTVSGVFPLVSADGTIPLDALDGISAVVDGDTLAVAYAQEVHVATCVAPAPLPVAPVHPVVTPVTHPVAAAKPAQLAQTGVETGGLLALGGVLLAVGGLTTLASRRPAR